MATAMKLLMPVTVLVALVAVGGKCVEAQVQHVVGGDRGWDSSSDVKAWSSGRLFRVGDSIWFAYSAAQDSVVELKSMGEYVSCDLTNPINMYSDGLNTIPLDGEGIRYFASGNLESCKSGLKLHVHVQPRDKNETQAVGSSSKGSSSSAVAAASGPTSTAPKPKLNHPAGLFYYPCFFGLLLWFMGL